MRIPLRRQPITFDCVNLSTFDATYYFAPPRNTPLRVMATYGGATHELTRDRDDANGWTFADVVVTVTGVRRFGDEAGRETGSVQGARRR